MDGKTIIYRQQKNFCNKPGCRKCREGKGHGPYWYAYQAVNGRTVRTYIGKTLPADAQAEQIETPTSSTAPASLPAPAPSPPRSREKQSNAPDAQRTHAAEEAEPMTSEVPIGRANQSPLVGRTLELSTLHQLLEQVQFPERKAVSKRPHAHCLVLKGETGIGKTRLAEEGAREAQRRGWTVIWSRAYFQEQGSPYRLWTAMLRNILSNAPDLLQASTERSALTIYQPLQILLPEMQEQLVGAGVKARSEAQTYETLSPELEELRLRDAIYTFLMTLSLTSPLLLVIDDIQWADESSARMLGHLARRMTEHQIVLLTTCLNRELAENRVLDDLIHHMQREQVVELLPVQPLSDEQIGALVSYLPPSAITQVQSQAAGNPFFAEELGYSLRITSAPTPLLDQTEVPAEEQTLPENIAAAIDRRLKRLTKDCQDLLGKAAVLGESFDFDLILEMEAGKAAGDEDTILGLLEEALTAGVLAEDRSKKHAAIYHFGHPLLTKYFYHRLRATRRARLHLSVAEALRRTYASRENEEAATITLHLTLGGAEPALVAHYAEMAANHAYTVFGYAEAERHYRMTLNQLAPTLLAAPDKSVATPLWPEKTLEQRLHLALLAERMADCDRILGKFQDARNLYTHVIQLRTTPPRVFATFAEEQLEAQIQAMLWSETAWIWRYTGDTDSARACYIRGAEVLHAAGITDGPAWGSLRLQRASLYWQEGYPQEALQAAQEALAFFTNARPLAPASIPASEHTRIRRSLLGDPTDLGRVLNLLGIICNVTGQYSEALKHLQQAMQIHDQYERRRESANTYCNIGHIYNLRGEYEKARHLFERALNYAEEHKDNPTKSVVLSDMAEMAAEQQRFDEAERLYRESLALVAEMNDREYLSTWHAYLGRTYQEQGKFQEAATAILHALSIARAMPNQPCIGTALITLANLRLALVEQNPNAPETQRQRALRHAEMDLQRALKLRGLDVETRTRAQLAGAHVARLQGDFALARQRGQEVCASAQHYELNVLYARCQKLLASLPEEEIH